MRSNIDPDFDDRMRSLTAALGERAKKQKKSAFKRMLISLSALTISIISALVGGFVFSKAWEWFVISKFHLPALGVIDSIGIFCVVGAISVSPALAIYTTIKDPFGESDYKEVIKYVLNIIGYLTVLLSAWIWHFFL